MHQSRVAAMQLKDFDERGNSALCPEAARLTEAKSLQFAPRVVAHITVRFEQAIQHVVVKANEHAVLGGPNVELVAIAAQLECRTISFESIFMRELRCAAMTNDIN